MARILYYLILIPLSYIPLPVLYVISDVLFFILYHVIKYRRSVVNLNLRRSFPEKSRSEITVLEREFYSHLCDLVVESIRMFSMGEVEARKRCVLVNPEVLDKYFEKRKSIIVVAGHFNNWEIGGATFPFYVKHHVMGIYAPMSNTFFNNRFIKTRGKFGLELVPKQYVTEWFQENRENPSIILFGSDQSPTHSKVVHWTTFLNQETAVMVGTERYAIEYDYPVFYVYVSKIKRGYYQMKLVLLEENPSETSTGLISEKHTRWLETQIQEHPQYWLWTHKRWKRKRKEGE